MEWPPRGMELCREEWVHLCCCFKMSVWRGADKVMSRLSLWWCTRSCMCIQEQNYSCTTIPSESCQGFLKRHPMVTWTLYRMLSAIGGRSLLKYSHHPCSSLILNFGTSLMFLTWCFQLVSINCYVSLHPQGIRRWFAQSQELDTVKIEANAHCRWGFVVLRNAQTCCWRHSRKPLARTLKRRETNLSMI